MGFSLKPRSEAKRPLLSMKESQGVRPEIVLDDHSDPSPAKSAGIGISEGGSFRFNLPLLRCTPPLCCSRLSLQTYHLHRRHRRLKALVPCFQSCPVQGLLQVFAG